MSAARPRRTGPFSAAAVLWMIAVGVVSFGGVLLLTAYGPELRRGGGGEHALSRSAVGYAGVMRLLKETGVPSFATRREHSGRELLVLTPGVYGEPLPKEPGIPTLVVLPKWRTQPHPTRQGWVRSAGLAGDPEAVLAGPARGSKVARREGVARPQLTARKVKLAKPFPPGAVFTAGPVERLQTVSGPMWEPLLVDETGATVLARHRERDLYVLADPDLFNNRGMKHAATARTAVAIVEGLRGTRPVGFDLTLHGMKSGRNLLRLALEPPFLGATLCMLAAALLGGLHAAARFGPAQHPGRAVALGKASLAENTAALVRLTKREHRMLPSYAAAIRHDAARAAGAPTDLGAQQLDAFLDRLSRTRGAKHTFTELAAEARRATNRDDVLRVARDLHRWRTEIAVGA